MSNILTEYKKASSDLNRAIFAFLHNRTNTNRNDVQQKMTIFMNIYNQILVGRPPIILHLKKEDGDNEI